MKNIFTLCIIFGLLPMSALSGISYTVNITEPHTHYVEVVMNIPLDMDSIDVKIPVWIPGSYMVREYAQNLESFRATNSEGKTLFWKKIRKNVWRVYDPERSGSIQVSYNVYAYRLTVRTSFVNAQYGYFNGPSFLMYTDEHRNDSLEVDFNYPESWSDLATALKMKDGKNDIRIASSYDELADCPIAMGNANSFQFEYNGIPHDVVVFGEVVVDTAKLKDDMFKIVDQSSKIFGSNPLNSYLFMFHVFPKGHGGLEHMNSTSMIADPVAFVPGERYRKMMSLVSHEYFHLWMVKRIKPKKLMEIDYEEEMYTSLLWLFEGFTSFYDDLIVARAGIHNKQQYLETVVDNIETTINTPGDQIQSVAEASYDAWIKFYRRNENTKNSTVSYYSKGAVIATAINLHILNETDGKHSLDDVMKELYELHLADPNFGVTESNVLSIFLDVTGLDMSGFFKDHIYGTVPIDYNKYLGHAGIELIRTDGHRAANGDLGATIIAGNGFLRVQRVLRYGPAWHGGLNVNDKVIAINDKDVGDDLSLISEIGIGEELKFTVLRMGGTYDISITAGPSLESDLELTFVKKPNDKQKMVRDKWIGGMVFPASDNE